MKGIKILVCAFVFMILGSLSAYAGGSWVRDSIGWWYQRGDGRWPNGAWQWIDGNGDGYAESYYFDNQGYCALNTHIHGNYVNADGMWTVNGQVQRMYVGNVIDHINNPGRTSISGTIQVLNTQPGDENAAIFHFDERRKINIMSGDGRNCFITDVDEVYIPDANSLVGYNGRRVTMSFNFREAIDTTDLEEPYGMVRAEGAYVVQ